jgi:hypothetical protein
MFLLSLLFCRKCIRNSSNTVREKFTKCSKQFNFITCRRRFACRVSRDASFGRLWGVERMEIGSGDLWPLDVGWRSLLYSIHPSSRSHRIRSVSFIVKINILLLAPFPCLSFLVYIQKTVNFVLWSKFNQQ